MTTSKDLVPRASLADAVYERIREDIMAGKLVDGMQLSQVHLAERFGVSRIPIREALRRLQAESLVISTPNHPFVVRGVSAEQVIELVDIRAALEDLALRNRGDFSTHDLKKLRSLNKAMAAAIDPNEFLKLDRQLHTIISGPEALVTNMINDVRDKVHKYVTNMVDKKPGRVNATAEHARILDALESKDIEAARKLLHDHIMASRTFIAGRLQAGTD
jgi:DNA-binding GntR family transcriptional regulator